MNIYIGHALCMYGVLVIAFLSSLVVPYDFALLVLLFDFLSFFYASF